MSSLSPAQAAKIFKVSRATLMKAIKEGAVSANRDDRGHWQIDTSELARVYDPRKSDLPSQSALGRSGQPNLEDDIQPISSSSEMENSLSERLAVAEAELRAEREKNEILTRHLEDVRRLLPAPPKRRRFWPF